jgi:mannosyl-oligosaccharide alpha-1,2-mannosidase
MFVQWSDEHRAHLMDWYIKPSQGGALIDARNILRPETVESLFLAYRATGDEIYREWGWKIFQAFQKYCRVPTGGYAGIEDVQVDPPVLLDRMETFWERRSVSGIRWMRGDGTRVTDSNRRVSLPPVRRL